MNASFTTQRFSWSGLGHTFTVSYHISVWFLQRIYGRHVFVNLGRFGPSFVLEKQRLARQPGARFAAAAFVTGALEIPEYFRSSSETCTRLKMMNYIIRTMVVLGASRG
jgi:hypothetical protein